MDAGTAALIGLDARFNAAVDSIIAKGDDWDEELSERQVADEDYFYGEEE